MEAGGEKLGDEEIENVFSKMHFRFVFFLISIIFSSL